MPTALHMIGTSPLTSAWSVDGPVAVGHVSVAVRVSTTRANGSAVPAPFLSIAAPHGAKRDAAMTDRIVDFPP